VSSEPIQLDAEVQHPERTSPPKKGRKKGSIAWLLPVLAAVGAYALFFNDSGAGGVQTELTAEQAETAQEISSAVKEHILENGIPQDPSEMDLPEDTDIMIAPDGSWIASTPDGQLISSPGALTPR